MAYLYSRVIQSRSLSLRESLFSTALGSIVTMIIFFLLKFCSNVKYLYALYVANYVLRDYLVSRVIRIVELN